MRQAHPVTGVVGLVEAVDQVVDEVDSRAASARLTPKPARR
jgi:hypothetical protein